MPSERVIVPRSLPTAPPAAVGAEVVVSGGQAVAQAPEQLDLPLASATQMYSARPDAPVRYVPRDPFAVPMAAAPVAAVLDPPEAYPLEAGEGAAADELGLELELPPHAATTSVTPISATLPAAREPILVPGFVIGSLLVVIDPSSSGGSQTKTAKGPDFFPEGQRSDLSDMIPT